MSLVIRDNNLPVGPKRHIHGPSTLCVGHCDRLRHVVRIIAAVLTGFESQPGAVTAGILWPHRLGQLSELLRCTHPRLPSWICSQDNAGGLKMEKLIEAALAHAQALREEAEMNGSDYGARATIEEAERWEALARAAQDELPSLHGD
jgi:hypothetical protein